MSYPLCLNGPMKTMNSFGKTGEVMVGGGSGNAAPRRRPDYAANPNLKPESQLTPPFAAYVRLIRAFFRLGGPRLAGSSNSWIIRQFQRYSDHFQFETALFCPSDSETTADTDSVQRSFLWPSLNLWGTMRMV